MYARALTQLCNAVTSYVTALQNYVIILLLLRKTTTTMLHTSSAVGSHKLLNHMHAYKYKRLGKMH